MIFSKFYILFIGVVFNVYGVMTVKITDKVNPFHGHRVPVYFICFFHNSEMPVFVEYNATGKKFAKHFESPHDIVLLNFVNPNTNKNFIDLEEAKKYSALTKAHVCFIKSKEMEKYSRLTKTQTHIVTSEENTSQHRFQLIADEVANVMVNANVNIANIIVASDDLGAVPAKMFCVKMGIRQRGIFKRFGTKILSDADKKVKKFIAINPKGLSTSDENAIQLTAQSVEVFYDKANPAHANAHIVIEVESVDGHGASVLLEKTATKRVCVDKHGNINIQKDGDVGSQSMQPPTEGDQCAVLGLLGLSRENNHEFNGKYTINLAEKFDEIQPIHQTQTIPSLPDANLPTHKQPFTTLRKPSVSFHCVFYQGSDIQHEFREFHAKGLSRTELITGLQHGGKDVLLYFVEKQPKLQIDKYIAQQGGHALSINTNAHVCFITSSKKPTKKHLQSVANKVVDVISHVEGLSGSKLTVVCRGLTAVTAHILCVTMGEMKIPGSDEAMGKVARLFAINPKELSETDENVIQPTDADFTEIIHNLGEATRATAHVLVKVKPFSGCGASEVFKSTATKTLAIAVDSFGQTRYVYDENVPSDDPSTLLARSVNIGLFGTNDKKFKVNGVMNLAEKSNANLFYWIRKVSSGSVQGN